MNFANKISLFRILIVPLFIACLIYYTTGKDYLRWVALTIFGLAVISDAVDGYIARSAKQISKAGLVLDPLGDKLLLMSAFIFLSPMSKLPLHFPLWVTFIVITRDIILLLGTLVIYLVRQQIDIWPTRLGKLTTTFQMIAVSLVILQWPYAYLCWWVAVFFTVVSGADYIRKGFFILYGNDTVRNHR